MKFNILFIKSLYWSYYLCANTRLFVVFCIFPDMCINFVAVGETRVNVVFIKSTNNKLTLNVYRLINRVDLVIYEYIIVFAFGIFHP